MRQEQPMALHIESCPNGECQKNEGGVRITVLDDFGADVLGRLSRLTRLPETLDPWVHIVIGEAAPACSCDAIHVLATRSEGAERDAICVVGDADWLAAALAPIVKLTVEPGKICIDLADLRAVFHGRGPIAGVWTAGETLEAAAASAILAAGPRLREARSVMLHIDAPVGTGLFDVNEVASRVQEAAPAEADVVFNFYGNGAVEGEMGSVRVTILIAGHHREKELPLLLNKA